MLLVDRKRASVAQWCVEPCSMSKSMPSNTASPRGREEDCPHQEVVPLLIGQVVGGRPRRRGCSFRSCCRWTDRKNVIWRRWQFVVPRLKPLPPPEAELQWPARSIFGCCKLPSSLRKDTITQGYLPVAHAAVSLPSFSF